MNLWLSVALFIPLVLAKGPKCPNDAVSNNCGTACYYYHQERLNYLKAVDVCKKRNGDLIGEVDEMEEAQEQLFNIRSTSLEADPTEIVNRISWMKSSKQAGKNPKVQCRSVGPSSFKITFFHCKDTYIRFLCKTDLNPKPVQKPRPVKAVLQPKCLIWKHPTGFAYRVHDELKTWAEAKEICAGEGGRLVLMNDTSKDDYIDRNAPMFPAWIGGRKEAEGFTWIDGSAVKPMCSRSRAHRWQPNANLSMDGTCMTGHS
ncbi:hypothetical protein L596_025446 [Steinernema carpocapsae]|uniref:C-type lectin domain-containing protein n=1 Tax=Steinernema carpocapsae TaxID=34508 RepID=A0A4U5M7S6_STECR|nr:hypothetical protein L596_025446 [Steinernema carpocapsae]